MKTIRVKPEKVCRNALTRSRGLMFAKQPRTTLFISKKLTLAQVHMFFVFFPLDVYFLDENKFITHKQTLNPFEISKLTRAKYILETKRNLLRADVGDRIELL